VVLHGTAALVGPQMLALQADVHSLMAFCGPAGTGPGAPVSAPLHTRGVAMRIISNHNSAFTRDL
jgi:hypothetical protein